jgi:ABC-type antimicrobial peptide transport system ATPase subunit
MSLILKPVVVEENKKYTKIMAEIYRKDPEHFDEELEKVMSKIIIEKEARLFFAEHIRNFNSELTKDKLLRLYKNVPDTEENRHFMT